MHGNLGELRSGRKSLKWLQKTLLALCLNDHYDLANRVLTIRSNRLHTILKLSDIILGHEMSM
jgi:hypothetical protein